MEAQFTQVAAVSELEQWLARSRQESILFFKHSLTCPISAAAMREMKRLTPELARRVGLVVVQTGRGVSQEIATRTGVRHESPQVILVRDEQTAWAVSHYDITAATVSEAMNEGVHNDSSV